MTRWEEADIPREPDRRGNYRENRLLAARQRFLDRPVLDEWALVLRAWLAALRPGWRARPKAARLVITHDIDATHKFTSWYRVARAAAAEDPPEAREACASAVLGAIRQQKIRRQMAARRAPWVAVAAAGLVAVAAGTLWLLAPGSPEIRVPAGATAERPFVETIAPPEVEIDMGSDDVRVYRLVNEHSADTAVCFVINPALES